MTKIALTRPLFQVRHKPRKLFPTELYHRLYHIEETWRVAMNFIILSLLVGIALGVFVMSLIFNLRTPHL